MDFFFPLDGKGRCYCTVLFIFTYPVLYHLFSLNVVVVISTYTVSQLFETQAVAV